VTFNHQKCGIKAGFKKVLRASLTPHTDALLKKWKRPLKRRDNFSRIFCEHNIYWISGRFKRANWSDVRLTDFHSFFYYRTLFLFPQNSNQAQHECGDMERGDAQVKGTEKTRSYKMKCVFKASNRTLALRHSCCTLDQVRSVLRGVENSSLTCAATSPKKRVCPSISLSFWCAHGRT
jgi:hypothetical protein